MVAVASEKFGPFIRLPVQITMSCRSCGAVFAEGSGGLPVVTPSWLIYIYGVLAIFSFTTFSLFGGFIGALLLGSSSFQVSTLDRVSKYFKSFYLFLF